MKQIILNSPKQLKIGLEKANGVKLSSLGAEDKFKSIVICGLGGSALPANLLTTYLPDLPMPVYSHRSYGLPPQANENSLIVCISFSGNTEETLSAYFEAVEQKLSVVAITTGGKLEELAHGHDRPVVVVPNDCLQPRFGTGYLLSALLGVLINSDVIEDKSKEILATAEALEPIQLEQTGKLLAKRLIDKIPVVYASNQWKVLARIWKIKFNENSKIMAFFNYFPELNHNEMVGLTNLKGKFHFILLKERDDHHLIKKRMTLFASLAKKNGAQFDFIPIDGKNRLEKIFNTLLISDWASYYLALEYGQDPIPVKLVEEFKKRLES